MKNIAKENFNKWKKALENQNINAILNLYSKNAILLPTFDKKIRIGRKEIQKYFEGFIKKKPKVNIAEEKTKIISEICYIHCGLYQFEIQNKNKKKKVDAKFTFVWYKNNDWEILHHHSSLIVKNR